jgi:hypothetical protein
MSTRGTETVGAASEAETVSGGKDGVAGRVICCPAVKELGAGCTTGVEPTVDEVPAVAEGMAAAGKELMGPLSTAVGDPTTGNSEVVAGVDGDCGLGWESPDGGVAVVLGPELVGAGGVVDVDGGVGDGAGVEPEG